MIERKEIERLIQSKELEDNIEFVWEMNCIAIPDLKLDGRVGDDRRFDVAEHIIHTFFLTETAQSMTDGAFTTFCEQFHADVEDITVATARTLEDIKPDDVCPADIATTLMWLWFLEASRTHGSYATEFKFFLYTVTDMAKDDQALQQSGKEHLIAEVSAKPSLLGHIISFFLKRRHA